MTNDAPSAGVPPDDDTILAPGTRFGKYEIVRLIGVGGMGAVYEATHSLLRKRVALKTLHLSQTGRFDARARFLREGETLARIRHPNVVDITDVGVQDGTSFLVMEFLEGENLREVLDRAAPFTEREAVQLVMPLVAGLAAAHAAGIVHRDIKPENVILARNTAGEIIPKLVDFGISKEVGGGVPATGITIGHAVVGTPYYMAPEQARGETGLDSRADQYAVGVLLYECITAKMPFDGKSLLDLMNKVASGKFEPPSKVKSDVTPEIEAVVMRAMTLEPSGRYPSTEELGRALLPFAGTRLRMSYERQFGINTLDSAPPPSFGTTGDTGRGSGPGRVPRTSTPAGGQLDASTLPTVNGLPRATPDRPSATAATERPPSDADAILAAPVFISSGSGSSPLAPIGARRVEGRPSRSLVAMMGVLVALVLVGGLVIAGGWWALFRTASATSAGYHVLVSAAPPTALFALDARPVGMGAFSRDFTLDGQEHVLRITATGFVPYEVRFRDAAPDVTHVELAAAGPVGVEPPRVSPAPEPPVAPTLPVAATTPDLTASPEPAAVAPLPTVGQRTPRHPHPQPQPHVAPAPHDTDIRLTR